MALEAAFREQETGADMDSLARKEGCALLFSSNREHLCTHCFHLERDRLIVIGHCSEGQEGKRNGILFSSHTSSIRFSLKPVSFLFVINGSVQPSM